MDILSFIGTVVFVTASGALSPGPLFVATVSSGSKGGPFSGIMAAAGHTIAELPIVLLLSAGLSSVADNPTVRSIVGLVGGVALILFGAAQITSSIKSKDPQVGETGPSWQKTPLLLGIVFTAMNPFFIAWWLALGSALILQALLLGSILGVLLMYVAHVWMDYAWLGLAAYLSHKGSRIMSHTAHRILMIALGVFMIYFGVNFVMDSVPR